MKDEAIQPTEQSSEHGESRVPSHSGAASGSLCIVCQKPHNEHDRCPECGYSYCDDLIHWDHYRCGQPLPRRP